MFCIIRNLSWQQSLWAVVLVSGGLFGLGMTAGQAQAQDYRSNLGRMATSYQQPNNLGTTGQLSNNMQVSYNPPQTQGYETPRTYPYSPYSSYNPYMPYPIYGGWNYPGVYPFYSGFFPWYNPVPNVVYPYVSPYVGR